MEAVKRLHATNQKQAQMNRFFNTLLRCISATTLTVTIASCSMMEDSIDDCPQGLYVRFVYDYNTQRADMFKDHVGHVALYLYDEQGNLAASRSVSNSAEAAPLSVYGYTMHFRPDELKPGRYRLQAVAMQRDWNEALTTPGAKYRRNTPSDAGNLSIALDRATELCPGTRHYAVSDVAPLDTLWHTLRVSSYLPQDGRGVPPMHRTLPPTPSIPSTTRWWR